MNADEQSWGLNLCQFLLRLRDRGLGILGGLSGPVIPMFILQDLVIDA